jgi:hypothetical protein
VGLLHETQRWSVFWISKQWWRRRSVATLALGSRPRQRRLARVRAKWKPESQSKRKPGNQGKRPQGCGPRRSPGVISHTIGSVRKCEGVNPHTPKATPTLGGGVPKDSWNFRGRLHGSKLNGLWRSLYHWKAFRT